MYACTVAAVQLQCTVSTNSCQVPHFSDNGSLCSNNRSCKQQENLYSITLKYAQSKRMASYKRRNDTFLVVMIQINQVRSTVFVGSQTPMAPMPPTYLLNTIPMVPEQRQLKNKRNKSYVTSLLIKVSRCKKKPELQGSNK